MSKTLAIVGTHPLTRSIAPFDDKNIDIMVFNSAPLADWCRRCTMSLELHGAEEYTNPVIETSGYWEYLQKQSERPVYMREIDPRVKAGRLYPLNEIIDKYLYGFMRGDRVNKYFTSSTCYAIALGLYLRYTRIEIYGIEMEGNTEYIYQRDGVGLWIGIALGLGVQIVIPEATSMFHAPLYGFEDVRTGIRREDFEEQAYELKRQLDDITQKTDEALGTLKAIYAETAAAERDGTIKKRRNELGTRYQKQLEIYQNLLNQKAFINGQYANTNMWMVTVEKMQIAAGKAQEVMALKDVKLRAQGALI